MSSLISDINVFFKESEGGGEDKPRYHFYSSDWVFSGQCLVDQPSTFIQPEVLSISYQIYKERLNFN